MSRFKSAVHNIGHHAVSGLSDFLQEAYGVCEAKNMWALKVDLLAGTCTQLDSNCPESFRSAISNLKGKYESILTDTSGVKLNDVEQAIIEVDFLVNDKRYEDHKKAINDMGVWYGHNPIYRLIVAVQLKNGQVYQEIFSDEQM
jgi:hypothetical protein